MNPSGPQYFRPSAAAPLPTRQNVQPLFRFLLSPFSYRTDSNRLEVNRTQSNLKK
jgi:hypothetical protein